jgi:transposase-like protein
MDNNAKSVIVRHKKCPYCGLTTTKKKGKLKSGLQRYLCLNCGKSFSSYSSNSKTEISLMRNEKMFRRWMKGDPILRIANENNLSVKQVHRIFLKHLKINPPEHVKDLSKYEYLQFDGKWINHRKRSVLILLDSVSKLPIAVNVDGKENKKTIETWFTKLREDGLNPKGITVDGLGAIVLSLRSTWPKIVIQRCIFHIIHQSGMWLRNPPRRQLAKELLPIINELREVYRVKDAFRFQDDFRDFLSKNEKEIKCLKNDNSVEKGIIRTIALIKNAMPFLFNHLLNPDRLSNTTGATEGYNKKIDRALGYDHCGLTSEHEIQFIKWYVYYDAIEKLDTQNT